MCVTRTQNGTGLYDVSLVLARRLTGAPQEASLPPLKSWEGLGALVQGMGAARPWVQGRCSTGAAGVLQEPPSIFLQKKISRLDRHINAVISFQRKELSQKVRLVQRQCSDADTGEPRVHQGLQYSPSLHFGASQWDLMMSGLL